MYGMMGSVGIQVLAGSEVDLAFKQMQKLQPEHRGGGRVEVGPWVLAIKCFWGTREESPHWCEVVDWLNLVTLSNKMALREYFARIMEEVR